MSNEPKDGGPAFPNVTTDYRGKGIHDTYSFGGMSLRDYFAGQALIGCLYGIHADGSINPSPESVANMCCIYADALVARLRSLSA
jgi:hypothetical protein